MKVTIILNYTMSVMTKICIYNGVLLPVIVSNLRGPGIENSQYLFGQKFVDSVSVHHLTGSLKRKLFNSIPCIMHQNNKNNNINNNNNNKTKQNKTNLFYWRTSAVNFVFNSAHNAA